MTEVERRKARRQRMFQFIEIRKNLRGCSRCGGRSNAPLELDHRIPRYLGGRPKHPFMKARGGRRRDWLHVFWYLIHPNIQVLCRQCHVNKTRQEDAS